VIRFAKLVNLLIGAYMKLGFTGSRFVGYEIETVKQLVEDLLDKYCGNGSCTVGHGGAIGVDQVVDSVARRRQLPIMVFEPTGRNKRGLLARNIQLASWADRLVAVFIHEYTTGTSFTLTAASMLGKEVEAYLVSSGSVKQLSREEIGDVVRRFSPTVAKYLRLSGNTLRSSYQHTLR